MALYEKVVTRVHAGQGYYQALGAELRASNRPARSVVNWRTPLHLSTLAFFPSLLWSRVILGIAALAALALGFFIMARAEAGVFLALQPLLMFGPLLACFSSSGIFFAEIWAGVLITISIELYAFGWWRAGLAPGLLALFFRELALPYVFISAILAWRRKRRQEMFSWLAGLFAYAIYIVFHAFIVTSLITPADLPNPAGWVQFGGLGFLLRTSSVGWLMILPPWIAAVYLPVAIVGLAGWMDPVASRMTLTVAAYMVVFAIIGHSVNLYWGAIYAPLLTFGVALSGFAFRDLLGTILPGAPHQAEAAHGTGV